MPPPSAGSVPPPRLALLALWSFAPGSRGDYASWDIPDNLMVWPKELIWPVHDGTPKTSYFGEGWEDPVAKKVVAKKGVPNPFKPGELMDVAAKPASIAVKCLALKKLKDMA